MFHMFSISTLKADSQKKKKTLEILSSYNEESFKAFLASKSKIVSSPSMHLVRVFILSNFRPQKGLKPNRKINIKNP